MQLTTNIWSHFDACCQLQLNSSRAAMACLLILSSTFSSLCTLVKLRQNSLQQKLSTSRGAQQRSDKSIESVRYPPCRGRTHHVQRGMQQEMILVIPKILQHDLLHPTSKSTSLHYCYCYCHWTFLELQRYRSILHQCSAIDSNQEGIC